MISLRITGLFTLVVFSALLLLIFSSSPSPSVSVGKISSAVNFRPDLSSLSSLGDQLYRPFRAKAHTPPEEQKNSTSGESKWYSDWTWLLPFSSSVTLDENRSVLPPLPVRPAVYTYYDSSLRKDKKEQDADARLLLVWRRAWYAKGFRPVILGPAEAMNNPRYEAVQRLKLSPELQTDFFRWLAWGNMGTGLLADWRCVPMGRYDDELLVYLRRGAIPTHITRLDKLENGLFAGEKSRINDAIQEAIKKADDKSKSMLDLVAPEFFKSEQSSCLAFYSSSAVTTHYPDVHEKTVQSPAEGRRWLADLINSHLHLTFHNTFPSGIAVLKPFPEYTTALVDPTLRLAKALMRCPEFLLPASCPPNNPKCHTCNANQPLRISQPSVFKNTTYVYTLGTLPHPYTLISLQKGSNEVTARDIRRETKRDPWLGEVTKEMLGGDIAGSHRASTVKNVIAGETAAGHSLWLTVESLPSVAGESLPSELLDELEWHFGFQIPRDSQTPEAKENEVKKIVSGPNPSKAGIEREFDLIHNAREALQSKDSNRVGIRGVAEAWNLADTEIWRFVRAFRFVPTRVSTHDA